MTMIDLDRYTRTLLERLVQALERQNELQEQTNQDLYAIKNILEKVKNE
jgi:hypothetical protein